MTVTKTHTNKCLQWEGKFPFEKIVPDTFTRDERTDFKNQTVVGHLHRFD